MLYLSAAIMKIFFIGQEDVQRVSEEIKVFTPTAGQISEVRRQKSKAVQEDFVQSRGFAQTVLYHI